jgi:lipopolysaccharide/colanic/teichoic acid biosynthesis glycosyltransferase
MKRVIDIFLSGLAALVLSPLLLPVILILRLTGEGEVFYRQERIGRNGRPFGILKFATMLKASPNLAGGDITVANDPRILPVGRVLRRTKINEVPQLFNVLLGDMSLIGPRPLAPRVVKMFPQAHWLEIGHLRPGLSGVGSIVFRDEEALLKDLDNREVIYQEAIIPYKAAVEIWYAQNQSVWLDVKLIAFTILAVVLPGFSLKKYLPDLPEEPAMLVALRKSSTGAGTLLQAPAGVLRSER